MDMFYIVRRNSCFLDSGNPNRKGWSMKQSNQTPFFKKEDGDFCFGREDKRIERLVNVKIIQIWG